MAEGVLDQALAVLLEIDWVVVSVLCMKFKKKAGWVMHEFNVINPQDRQ